MAADALVKRRPGYVVIDGPKSRRSARKQVFRGYDRLLGSPPLTEVAGTLPHRGIRKVLLEGRINAIVAHHTLHDRWRVVLKHAGGISLRIPGRVLYGVVVVIDEVAGMCISLLFLPVTIKYVIAALILFRFFDIAKPLFIRKSEALPAGWGVMADDLLAGIFANLILQIVARFNLC